MCFPQPLRMNTAADTKFDLSGVYGMSLKAFHIVFVSVSTLLCAGFGAWGIRSFRSEGDVAALIAGVGSLVGVVILLIYGRWFLHKLRGVSYL